MFQRDKINFLKVYSIFIVCSFFVFQNSVFPAKASDLPFNLRGQLLIQAENSGQAWYVDKPSELRHYLPDNESSFEIVKKFGLGISNENLIKIPVAVDPDFAGQDSDKDGLDDKLEKAIGTDFLKADSDGDGYKDGLEIKSAYNPSGPGKLPINSDLAAKLAGSFLLQVESHGEAWYVNPADNSRYYIADYGDLFRLIRVCATGISDRNLGLIADSALIAEGASKKIKIDVGPAQRLYYFLGETQIGSFSVSAGQRSMPTPKGEFKIINRNPKAWSNYGLWMPYWLGLGNGSFGIHELPIWPSGYREGEDHLGTPVSHGCIRLGIGPAQFIYNWAEIGTPVEIY